jgi:hypothetical protein
MAERQKLMAETAFLNVGYGRNVMTFSALSVRGGGRQC